MILSVKVDLLSSRSIPTTASFPFLSACESDDRVQSSYVSTLTFLDSGNSLMSTWVEVYVIIDTRVKIDSLFDCQLSQVLRTYILVTSLYSQICQPFHQF
jgi:hypothetical protein